MSFVRWVEKKESSYFYDVKYLQVEMSTLRDLVLANWMELTPHKKESGRTVEMRSKQ